MSMGCCAPSVCQRRSSLCSFLFRSHPSPFPKDFRDYNLFFFFFFFFLFILTGTLLFCASHLGWVSDMLHPLCSHGLCYLRLPGHSHGPQTSSWCRDSWVGPGLGSSLLWHGEGEKKKKLSKITTAPPSSAAAANSQGPKPYTEGGFERLS